MGFNSGFKGLTWKVGLIRRFGNRLPDDTDCLRRIFQTACEESARCSSNVSRDWNVWKKLQSRGHLSKFLPAFIKPKESWTYLAAWWRWRRGDPPGNVNCGAAGPGNPYGPTAVSSLPSPKCSSFVPTHRHSTTTLQCDNGLSQGNKKCT